jgi:6,7-dimethyl-8-ribityllumazine synthase
MPTYEGRLDATGLRIALLASRFNETITKSLLEGALSALA